MTAASRGPTSPPGPLLRAARRFDFPGKRRLRAHVRLPQSGIHEADLGGASFRLDLHESLHRDYYFGLYDQLELGVIRALLANGGDFVDVGAHIGLYAVHAARALESRGRVLALEPNPRTLLLLEQNVALNGCANVVIERAAVGGESGSVRLFAPRVGDSAWSSLTEDAATPSEAIDVTMTTLDQAVARHGLRPAVVKIDVEGHETDVLRGAAQLLERRPALIVELVEENAAVVVESLRAADYRVARLGTRRLERWPESPRRSNALFVQPAQADLLGRRRREVPS